MQTSSIRLNNDDDLLNKVKEIAINENFSGYILGVIGDLSQGSIKCPNEKGVIVKKGTLEIISLVGTFSPTKTHLHLSFSDSDCKVWGGHLEEGSVVLNGTDLLLGILSEQPKPEKDNKQEIKVELMVIPNCAWCSRTIRILNSKRIPYKLVNVTDDRLFQEAKNRSGSSLFPQIYINGNYIGGYSEFSNLIQTGGIH